MSGTECPYRKFPFVFVSCDDVDQKSCGKADVEDPKEPSADESSEDPDADCTYEADADPSNDSVSEKTCDATDDDP